MMKTNHSREGESEPTAFDRFRNLAKQLVAVPKEEFDQELEREKAAKQPKVNDKPATA